MVAWVLSDAVTVLLPAVLNVTLKFCVPAASAVLPGRTALVSVQLMPIGSFVLITFQLASTAFTVTVKAVLAIDALGVPILPMEVPGAFGFSGATSCNL